MKPELLNAVLTRLLETKWSWGPGGAAPCFASLGAEPGPVAQATSTWNRHDLAITGFEPDMASAYVRNGQLLRISCFLEIFDIEQDQLDCESRLVDESHLVDEFKAGWLTMASSLLGKPLRTSSLDGRLGAGLYEVLLMGALWQTPQADYVLALLAPDMGPVGFIQLVVRPPRRPSGKKSATAKGSPRKRPSRGM